jgi:hypothetical protein
MAHVMWAISPALNPAFGRQQNTDLVPQWVSAGFGEQQEVFEIVVGQNLCLFSAHRDDL